MQRCAGLSDQTSFPYLARSMHSTCRFLVKRSSDVMLHRRNDIIWRREGATYRLLVCRAPPFLSLSSTLACSRSRHVPQVTADEQAREYESVSHTFWILCFFGGKPRPGSTRRRPGRGRCIDDPTWSRPPTWSQPRMSESAICSRSDRFSFAHFNSVRVHPSLFNVISTITRHTVSARIRNIQFALHLRRFAASSTATSLQQTSSTTTCELDATSRRAATIHQTVIRGCLASIIVSKRYRVSLSSAC